jgi:methylphosphotriester-DNA--protein-cysteine methyltransferase
MHPKDLAAKYEVKVFDSPSAAEAAGFQLGQRMSPRNVWNRDSAASAILFDLLAKRKRGEVSEIAIVLEINSVAGAFKTAEAAAPAESEAGA